MKAIVNGLFGDANNALVSIRVSLSCLSQVRRVLPIRESVRT